MYILQQIEEIQHEIPVLASCTRIERLLKGFSSDHKYIIYHSQGEPQYILRTFELSQFEQKEREFQILQRVEATQIACSRPVVLGKLPSLALGYMLLTYVEGDAAEDILPQLTEEQQYLIGVEAGHALKSIHRIKPQADMPTWYDRTMKKHQRYREQYAMTGITLQDEQLVLNYIDQHLHLMKGRPSFLQHDDFHPGNLIVSEGALAGVIDFNRYDWGDPFHEFLKIGMFSVEVSVPFSIGQIHGYFNGDPSTQFWKLYTLYIAMTSIASVVWTLKEIPASLDDMLQRIYRMMEEHRQFTEAIPSWYEPMKR